MARVTRGYSTVSDSTRIRNNSLYVGFITENSDAQRMGRLKVWIPELASGGAEDSNSWILVSYVSPFAGATNPQGINGSNQTSAGSQQSYGWWSIPPDLGNQVLVGFVNGDVNRGYWLGCIYQQNMNHMVPGIACNTPTTSVSGDSSLPPVVEYNKINQTDPNNPQRPPFVPLANGLVTEGLQADPERGPSSTSARREAPSKVFGFLTPRGNTMHVDDNPENEFIRIRTRSGTQVLVDETTGMVYINSKLGNAWLEISDAGVDIYSANSVSIRAQQDFNIRADRNIIFDAGSNIFLKAGQDVNIQSANDIVLGSNNQLVLSSTNNTSLTVGANLNLSVVGNMATQASGNISELAAGNNTRQAAQILDNSGGAASVTANPASVPQPKSVPDIENGSSATLETIVSRMPTHEPWSGHPHIGVPVEPGEATFNPGQGQGPVGGATTYASNSVATGTGTKNITSVPLAGCATGVSTIPCPTDTWNALKSASSTTGANFGTLCAISQCESGFQPAAHNPGGASGLFQFVPTTWTGMVTQYGSQYNFGTNDINDPVANATAGGLYIQQNAKSLGVDSSDAGTVYLGHMLGAGGANSLLNLYNANPNLPLSQVPNYPGDPLNSNIQANSGWINGNEPVGGGGVNLGPNATVGQFVDNIRAQMNGLASAYNTQAGLPAPCSRNGSSPTNTNVASKSSNNTTGVTTTNSMLGHA